MNALLNINVRVAANQANAALNGVNAQLKGLAATGNATGGGLAGFAKGLDAVGQSLIRSGKSMQWVGRQMEFAFTLPIAAAGAIAGKFALANQKATAELAKVYGLLANEGVNVKQELNDLGTTMELLSNKFGVQQSKVIDVAKAWAEAGSSGVGLARSVQNTLEAAVVGSEDLTKTTENLIAMQSAYHLSSTQLRTELANLDLIQIQSGITFSGLIDVIKRAGSTAAVAGIDIRHLAAMAASIVPAAGTASQAGNALRTIISRMLVPTKDAADLLGQMGINVEKAGWSTLTGTQRFELLAKTIAKLPDSKKLIVDTFVAARFQLNRFSALVEDAVKQNGFYQRSLRNTSDESKALAIYSQQLTTVLSSNPQKLQILWVQLQNALAHIIIPLLPAILGLVARITAMVQAFQHLNPEVQQLVLGGLLVLALMGPVIRYIGAFRELAGVMVLVMKFMVERMVSLGKAAQIIASDAVAAASVFGKAWAVLVGFLDTVWAAIVSAGETAALALMYAWEAVVSFFESATLVIAYAWEGLVVAAQNIGIAVFMVWDAVGTAIAGVWETVQLVAMYSFEGIVQAAGEAVAALAAILAAPEALIVTAIAAIIVGALVLIGHFRSQVKDAFAAVIHAAAQLPGALANIFMAVVHVVSAAMQKVIDWLSYLNPFQRHSPSLVEMVTAGTTVISDQYRQMAVNISNSLQRATGALTTFKTAVAGSQSGFDAQEFASKRADIAKVAPQAAPAADALIGQIVQLKGVLAALDPMIAAQSQVVANWSVQLMAANDKLDAQQAVLDGYKNTLDAVTKALDAAKSHLTDLVNTPIQGMKAMSDQIFANTMAQKQLQLEIMKMEDAGQSIDDINKKMAELQGTIEQLRGEAASLRASGAGSDVLGPIADQIAALQQAQGDLQTQASPIQALQAQLDALQRQGQEMDLTQSLQFDPLKKQIDDVTNSMKEMPFDQLLAQIIAQQKQVDQLQITWQSASDTVAGQQAVVDQLKASRDTLQSSYDVENKKLEALKQSYSDVKDQIDQMTQALDNFISASKSASDSQSMADKLFNAPAGNFPDVTGSTGIGREADQTIADFNKNLQDQLDQMGKDFGKLDPFKPIKDAFNSAWKWIKDHAGSIIKGVVIAIALIIGETFLFIPTLIVEIVALGLYALFGPGVFGAIAHGFMSVIGAIWSFIQTVFSPIKDVFMAILGGVVDAFVWLGGIVAAIFSAIGTAIVWTWQNVISPVFDAIVYVIQNYVVPILQMLWAIVDIIFTLIGRAIKWVWDNIIWPIFQGIGDLITQLILPVLGKLGVVADFIWHWIGVGLSALWNDILQPIWHGFVDLIQNVVAPVFGWLLDKIIKPVFSAIGEFLSSVWDGIVSGVEHSINFFIRAFNFLADAVNAVADFANIKVHVDHMPLIETGKGGGGGGGSAPHMLAMGGIIPETDVGAGFVTNRPRAIVGEGGRYPEYVIPTDPRYRGRAKDLYGALGRMIGTETGGPGWHTISGAIGAAAGALRKGAVMAAAAAPLALADAAIGVIPSANIRSTASTIKDDIYNWLKGQSDRGRDVPPLGSGLEAGVGDSATGPLIDYLRGTHTPFRVTATTNGVHAAGSLHYSGHAVDFAGLTPSYDSNDLLAIDKAFADVSDRLLELIYAGPGHIPNIKNGKPFDYSPTILADHHDHVHAALYNGGIVRGSRDGTVIRAGERGRDEAVIPLPNGGKSLGTREFHFHGDLSFPNITSGDDAKKFVDNLEKLVG